MSLIDYAKSELDRLPKDKTGYQERINQNILDIIQVFSDQGHSGLTASYVIGNLMRLLNYEPITPLTGEESEWGTDASKDQNNRCYHVFRREDGTAYDTEARIFSENGGKTWYTSSESFKDVEFPYWPPNEPERIILKDKETKDDQIQ